MIVDGIPEEKKGKKRVVVAAVEKEKWPEESVEQPINHLSDCFQSLHASIPEVH